jgi:glutamate/tyrosine decarboxylase-like PLP-dependent enzyme
MSLDLDPEALRALGHRTVDLIVDSLAREVEDPVLARPPGPELFARVDRPLPREGTDPAQLLDELRDVWMDACRKNGHPRFFGYVCASADPVGALFDGVASVFNQNVTAWRSAPGATEMERLVVRWLDELVGFGGGGGVLTSGGSAANATALASALSAGARRAGAPLADALPRLTAYVSSQAHLSLAKALRVFGVPEASVRGVAVDDRRRMLAGDLDRRIAADLTDGRVPALVCATAGTANTGAIDPLDDIAEVCARRGVWMHVDGAYGAPAAATAEYAFLRRAFARADSLVLDPHKWLFAPLDVGCVLLREPEYARAAFRLEAEYVKVTQEEPREAFAFFDHGLELSRRNRALKVWAILAARGADALAAVIADNVALRRHLDERVASESRLEPLGSDLSISCFRYVRPGAGEEELSELNSGILEALVEGGHYFLSPTKLEGRYALRVCIVNFRTRRSDVDELVDDVLRLGAE